MGLLNGKNIVIMGVANKWSIAWGIAKKFKEEGAKLIFTYFGQRSEEHLKELIEEEGITDSYLIPCDVTKDEDIENAFARIKDEIGVIHGVAHCIAHAKKEELQGNFYDTSREGFLMAHDVSAYSLVKVAKEARKVMTEGGSIVTLTYLGSERAVKNYNVMGVAKASLEASVRYLAVDLAQDNIIVNAISAGPIKTLAAKGVKGFTEMLKKFEEVVPARRLVTTEEIANTALFLCSGLATGITGETIHVDNGFNMIATIL